MVVCRTNPETRTRPENVVVAHLLRACGALTATALIGGLILAGGAGWSWATAAVSEEDEIISILAEIDPWVVEDTTRVLEFIEQHNRRTDERISSSPHWESTLADLGDLLGIDYIGAPAIGPQGRIYFQMRITGEQEALFYMDGPWGWPMQITPNGWEEKGLHLGNYRLSPNGEYLYQRVMKLGDENWDIHRFERDGRHTVLLEDRSIAFGTPHVEDSDTFYCSIDNREQIWLARYTLSTASLDTLYTEPGAYYLLDLRDDKLLCLRLISFSESQLFEVDAGTGEARDLTGVRLYWSGDYTSDGRILTLTDALSEESEFLKLALMDPVDAPVKPGDMKVLFDPGVEIDDVYFRRETGLACVMLNTDGYSDMVMVDLEGNVTTVPSPGVGIIDHARMNDRGDLVFSFNSPSVAPTAYCLGAGEPDLREIGRISTFGFDFSGTDVSVVRYRSADGTAIPALLYLPQGAERNGSNPCIVSYHGGPPGQSRPYFQRNIAFALSRGVVFLFPNVRGSTGYGPAWEKADDLDARFVALADAESALDFMYEQRWTSADRTAIWGASYGGYTVNYLAVHAPEKFACAVSEVGIADIDWCNQHSDQTFLEGWEREMGEIGSGLTRRLSPIFSAASIARPMLVTAGFNDPRVPPSGPRRFVRVLEELGKDVFYFEETEAGHGAALKSMTTLELARAYTFMFDHIMD